MYTYQREGMRVRITHAYLSGLPSMFVVYYREQLRATEDKVLFKFCKKKIRTHFLYQPKLEELFSAFTLVNKIARIN